MQVCIFREECGFSLVGGTIVSLLQHILCCGIQNLLSEQSFIHLLSFSYHYLVLNHLSFLYLKKLLYSIAWIVLILELFSQVCIRPSNYSELLKNEQAYCPSTVRHINRFHLVIEVLALVFVVPDFLHIFHVDFFITSVKAAIYTTVGGTTETWGYYALGYFYFFTTRTRHKRTNWINEVYFKAEDATDTNSDSISTDTTAKPENPTDKSTKNEVSRNHVGSFVEFHWSILQHSSSFMIFGFLFLATQDDSKKKQKNCEEFDLLPKAAKIGTALLLVNSQRGMLLL